MENTTALPAFMLEPTFWVFASFVLFTLAAFVFGRKAALGVLDSKIAKIRSDIELASNLKNEAQALVNQYQNDIKNATVQADEIIRRAQVQAAEIMARGEKELVISMERREAMMAARIVQMEQNAVDDLRRYAAELAVSATTEIIAQNMTSAKTSELASQSIQNLRDKIN